MALAPFFQRVNDAIGSVANITQAELVEVLGDVVISISIAERVSGDQALTQGALFLVNLLARLYPRLQLDGPEKIVADCESLATRINPNIDIYSQNDIAKSVSVLYGDYDVEGHHAVSVTAAQWCISVDELNPVGPEPATSFAALASACFAAAEVFRIVFTAHLGKRGRTARQPGSFDLVSARSDVLTPAAEMVGVRLPDLHLAGAGAIGQACLLALAASGTDGTITVVDPEVLELSNLQRYVLSTVDDVGALKTTLAERAMQGSGWTVETVPTAWGLDPRAGPRLGTVLVALDSVHDRIGVAVGLHERVFNAYTQPADLGWSRHEAFGERPCLACLYYPDHARPSDDELIARAIGQHRLRILSYFATRTLVGFALPDISAVAGIPAPPEAATWVRVPLLADLVASGVISAEQAPKWAARTIGQLYAEGICGGGIVQTGGERLDAEVVVPLAHQSAFAGVMLALQPIIAAVPTLASYRSDHIDHRIDLLSGFPQVVPRPRSRTMGCFCSDPAFVSALSRASEFSL